MDKNIDLLKNKYPHFNTLYNQKGGEINKPNGGFPSLIKCDKEDKKSKIKMRGIESLKEDSTNIVSIEKIMDNKNIKPLF